jgi:hypothetical protein
MSPKTAYPTPYPEVNAILDELLESIRPLLGRHLVGLYLEGSLTGSDFDSMGGRRFEVRGGAMGQRKPGRKLGSVNRAGLAATAKPTRRPGRRRRNPGFHSLHTEAQPDQHHPITRLVRSANATRFYRYSTRYFQKPGLSFICLSE